jgi:hypothetical protein
VPYDFVLGGYQLYGIFFVTVLFVVIYTLLFLLFLLNLGIKVSTICCLFSILPLTRYLIK